ncbi:sulfatase [Vibrio alfacsensis]|uniref:sulfatase family protein n=1 Tax=Vibrio alfacsensis TaxID=1074311 RepID=UPI002ADE7104|nr:sulfatase [Vibrio alfacsensis]WQE77888.1 sulfatase [Vibrio alfacsensis]
METTRRGILKGIVATGIAASMPTLAKNTSTANTSTNIKEISSRPNLLIVFPDEMRTQSMQFMGEDPSLTPYLNQFAKQSVVLTENVANYPLCSPFRGTMLTGKYPISHGITGNCNGKDDGNSEVFAGSDFGHDLKENETCWSDILKENGYSLGYIGKWHMDSPSGNIPDVDGSYRRDQRYWNDWTAPERRHGFDFWYAYGTGPSYEHPIYWTNETPRDKPIQINQWSPEHETDIALKFIANEGGKLRENDKPFALVVSMVPPHSPYNMTPKKNLDRFAGKTSKEMNNRPNVNWNKKWPKHSGPKHFKSYMAMVNSIDEQFGRMLDQLDQQGLADNTLVVFMSDHGSCMGSHGVATKNVIYEESIRTPMLMRLPNKLKPKFDNMLFSSGDICPTMLGLLDLEDHIPDSVEGTNFAKHLMGTAQQPLPTSQPYIYIPYGATAFGRRGVRTERYTLQIERRAGKPLKYSLWDRYNDKYQMKNIASHNMDLVEHLIHSELLPWLEKTNDPWRPTEVPASVLKGMS